MRNDEGTFARRHLVWAVIVLGREAGDFEGKISEGATSRARRDRSYRSCIPRKLEEPGFE